MLIIQIKPDKTLKKLFYENEIYPNLADEYFSLKSKEMVQQKIKVKNYLTRGITKIDLA